MNAHTPLSEFARKIGAALILGTLAINGLGGQTDLATEPFTSASSLKAKPNVMFVLDDSGTMNRPYLPDWAGTWRTEVNPPTILTPSHLYFNGAYNGVAYNPANYYRPPVMYTNTGALDTTTFPSQNGQSAARGGDATATAGVPNWRAVKVDAYGVLSTATVNLEGLAFSAPGDAVAVEPAFSYITVPGEYCTSTQLRTCVASATPTGIYTFPARLRWCDTAANALISTAEAGTRCQAANIDPSAAELAAGVTRYTFPRIPGPRQATITVTGTGSVTSILVDGLQILSSATGIGADSTAVATAIASKINACTYGLVGACGVVGYSATSLAGVVTVQAPGTTSATPVVTGGTTTANAFLAPTGPVTSTITVNSVGAITGITVGGSQILSAPTAAPAATAAPVVTGIAHTSSVFAGSPNVTATITLSGSGTNTVTSVKVDGNEILKASTGAFGSTSSMATAIRDKINDCTAALAGNCTVAGYSATRSGSVVTVTAPKPVVTGATTTANTFSGAPNQALITVSGYASAVTSITVGGLQILSAGTGTAGITSNTLMATAIRNKINACTIALSGACTVVGYSATSSGNAVTITAPGGTAGVAAQIAANINACTAGVTGNCTIAGYRASSNGSVVTLIAPLPTAATPAVSPSTTTTATAMGFGFVPGATLLTVITPPITSYPYPGTATKAVGRTDCAGTTCTYAEEMTNYANWYTYYRTRMQMMKTSAGIAFSSVDDQFRVGYSTLNNGTGSDFINPSDFDGSQKYLWYSKFYLAKSQSVTPLREALANTGRLYAGKLSTVNGVPANDPMQYSCQQNFTILSTDGFWQQYYNKDAFGSDILTQPIMPKRIDGVTDIGQQDHNDPRPYYDGGTQTLTSSTTWWNDEQFAANTVLWEQRSRQQRVTTSQLTKSEVTTTTWPYQLQTTPLQTRITPLTQSTKNLEKRSYALIDSTRQLQQNETFLQVTTRPLERYTFNPVETTTPLRQSVTKITVTTYPLEQGSQSPQARITQLQVGTQSPQSRTYQLEIKTEPVSKLISALQKMTQTINSTTSPLQKTETFIQATTQQLQSKDEISTDLGDTWHDTPWVDVSSCTVTTGNLSTYVRNRRCQYAAPVVTPNVTSCAVVTASSGPTNYTVGLSRACAYQAPSAPVAVGSCTVRAASGTFAATQVACGYGSPGTPSTGLHTCSANDQSASSATNGATLTGNKVECAYDAGTWVAAGSCTDSTPANFSGDKISCRFVAGTPTATAPCVDDPQAASPYTGDRVTCSYSSASFVNAASDTCNPVTPSPAYSASRVSCRYNTTPTAYADVPNCTNYSQATTSNMTGDRVQCRHNPTPVWADALPSGSETCAPNTPADFLSPITTCRYSGTGSYADVGTCTPRNQVTTAPMSGDMVECQWNPTPTWTPTASCPTPNTPATFTGTKTSCRYNPTANSGPTAGQSTCTPRDQPTTAAMTLDKTVCAWDATPTTTTTSPCTWSVPASPTTPRTTCAYDTAFNTTASPASCTPVPQANSNTANGQVWSGSIVTCGYAAAVVTTLDPVTGSCTPTGTNTGPPFTSYTTCGWGTGGVVTGQPSCTKRNALAGPFTNGAFVACAYQATPVTTNVIAPTPCTARAQDTTNFSATEVTCSYAAPVPVTIVAPATCTDVPMSTGPTTYTVNTSHSCAYDTTPATLGNGRLVVYSDNTSTCVSNRQTTSPYTTPAVDCTYSATAVNTAPATCTRNAPQSGPSGTTFTGADITCGYGAPGAWNVVVAPATCTTVAQTATPGITGTNFVPAVECAYNGTRVDTLVDTTTCPAADYPGDAGPTYSTLLKKVCVPGAFPSAAAPVVTTPTNSCDTTTVNGSPGSGVTTQKITTCTYLPPVTVNAGTAGGGALPCVPVAASSGPAYVTAVSCPVTDTGWVPVTTSPLDTSCVPSGTPEPVLVGDPPLAFDGTSGKIVQCRWTDTTAYNATFAQAAVPVPRPAYPPALNPVAVPNCTVGVIDNTATGVQTTCIKPVAPGAGGAFPTINQDPIPVDPTTCNPTVTPVAPAYIWTRCNTVTSTGTVRGCNPVSPTSPLWETKTCADDGSGTRNTLADVAAYYYKTDLRSPALSTATFDSCKGAVIPATGLQGVLCSATNPMNNVPTTTGDPNPAQHMTTFTLGLGASGYMQYSSTYPTDTSGDFYTVKGVDPYLPDNGILADPTNGVCAWQSSNLCNWPFPVTGEQTTIDDLWHAGVNGHGAYFSATDPASLASSITSALEGVAATGGSGASPTASNASIKQGDNYFFNSNYMTLEWTGELVRRQINPITAEASTAVDWSAQAKLDNKLWTSRAIWTFDNSVATTKLRAFNSANFAANSYFRTPHISAAPNGLTQYLCASASVCLSATDQDASHAAGANLVNYLAGDRSNEGAETNNNKYYRQRTHVLGDLVNAQVVYVNKPQYNYADPGYDAFLAAQSGRVATLYAGANDGMLHAFRAKGSVATENLVVAAATAVNAATMDQSNASLATDAAAAVSAANAAVAADTLIGQEMWAYIPTMVFPHLYKLADKNYKNKHRYFVDGSPVSADICTSNCSVSGATWKTILVGGLGRGGRGYYALDITDPTSPKALWEFTDANLGYSFGSPQVGKLADGTWVVLLASGYNNVPNEDGAGGDGVGRLFVLNASDGTLIRSISTGVGDTATPSGLAKVTAQVINPDSDNSIEAVYGGDLLGNLWRFDVNNNIGATGFDAQLLAVLKDGAGNLQPITTKPQVTSIPTTGEKLVIIGTGSYLALSDATNTNTQSVYAIKDARATGVTPGTAIFDNPGGAPRLTGTSTAGFVRQIFTQEACPAGAPTTICDPGELVITATSNPVDFATKNGWFFDLIASSERANTDIALGLGALVINTNIPSVEACEVGGTSYQYDLNYLTGAAIGATASSPLEKRVVGKQLANQLASSPILLMTASGKLVALSGLAGGGVSIQLPTLPPGASISRRTAWRELIRE